MKQADLALMTPNAWGDFFAGCFAPLAFLWLVLGYLQQGEELKMSTKALTLQAEELKNSVEQQRALVEVSRQQVESEREALLYERQLREEAARPNFLVVPAGGIFRGDGHSIYNLLISNTGHMASKVLATVNFRDGKTVRLFDMSIFDRGEQHRTSFELPAPLEGSDTVLQVTFTDAVGRLGETTFAVSRQSAHSQSALQLTKIEAQPLTPTDRAALSPVG